MHVGNCCYPICEFAEKCKFIKVKQCEKILRLWLRELFVSGFVTDRAGKRVQTRHTFSLFELNQVTAEQVLEAVTTFLRGEKGMEVQSVATPNGYLIQTAQADTLRTLSGMKLATTVELTINGTQLNVTLGEGQWADKLGAGAVGLFLLWPLAVTAGIGAYKQKKLPSEIFEVVYRCTMGEPTSFRMAGVPVNAAPTAPAGAVCPQCGAQIFANARFCSACGAKLQTVCPGCGAPVKPGSKFCSECGQALS